MAFDKDKQVEGDDLNVESHSGAAQGSELLADFTSTQWLFHAA